MSISLRIVAEIDEREDIIGLDEERPGMGSRLAIGMPWLPGSTAGMDVVHGSSWTAQKRAAESMENRGRT